jgi:hypothetical protein
MTRIQKYVVAPFLYLHWSKGTVIRVLWLYKLSVKRPYYKYQPSEISPVEFSEDNDIAVIAKIAHLGIQCDLGVDRIPCAGSGQLDSQGLPGFWARCLWLRRSASLRVEVSRTAKKKTQEQQPGLPTMEGFAHSEYRHCFCYLTGEASLLRR